MVCEAAVDDCEPVMYYMGAGCGLGGRRACGISRPGRLRQAGTMWLGGMEEGVRVRERQWERVCVRAYVCVCVCVCACEVYVGACERLSVRA